MTIVDMLIFILSNLYFQNESLGQRVSSYIKLFIDQQTSTANVITISDSAASPDPM